VESGDQTNRFNSYFKHRHWRRAALSCPNHVAGGRVPVGSDRSGAGHEDPTEPSERYKTTALSGKIASVQVALVEITQT
jgi:hypothetical protein